MAFQRQNTQTKQIIYGSLYSHYRTIDLNLTLFESKFALGLVLLQVCTWPICMGCGMYRLYAVGRQIKDYKALYSSYTFLEPTVLFKRATAAGLAKA